MFACLAVANLLLAAATQSAPPASEVMAAAKAQAASQQKSIFLIFHASWCGYCKRLDKFLEAPENKGIIDKHFVVVHLTILESAAKASLNNPGAIELRAAVGGKNAAVPFFAFLDAGGAPIVNSITPKGANIGYPDSPAEVDWFMVMLRKAVPAIQPEEARTLESWLRTNGKTH